MYIVETFPSRSIMRLSIKFSSTILLTILEISPMVLVGTALAANQWAMVNASFLTPFPTSTLGSTMARRDYTVSHVAFLEDELGALGIRGRGT